MTKLRIGSDEHKRVFCREFTETFRPYEPRDVAWPELDAAGLQRLRSLPFWEEAVSSERTAAARVRRMADVEQDPVLREAIALQAYEEERHAQLLERLLERYGITIPGGGGDRPRDAEWGFVRMGYGECFDSFFAFGLFKVASDTGFFPAPLVKVFDGVMQEEARHIIFFTNWAAHRQRRLPLVVRPWFAVRRTAGVALQALGRVKTALQLRDADAGDDFTMQVPEELADPGDMTLKKLALTCMGENSRRLAEYDQRLLRPRVVPRLVGLAMRVLPGDDPSGGG
ncbi:MAG: ferritin-like domain-containing protein [Candidatus Binatia bacterium]